METGLPRTLAAKFKTVLLPLLKKGFLAIGDQGLFAGAHFLLNVFLARWLTPAEYGAFSVAYSIFLFLMTLHDALLVQPMLVFGPERFRDRFPSYIRTLVLWGNGGLAVIGGLLLAGISFGFGRAGSSDLATALIGIAAAQPFLLFLWLVRRATYVPDRQHLAVGGGALYVVLVLGALYVLRRWAVVSAPVAFAIMGGAGLVVGAILMQKIGGWTAGRSDRTFLGRVFQKHWSYGRWAAGTGVMIWTMYNIYILLLPIWGSLSDSGALKALMNIVQPALHVYMAFSVLLIPEFVKAQKKGRLQSNALLVAGCLLAGGGVYWFLIGTFGSELIVLFYGEQYSAYGDLLWLLGALPFVDALKTVLEAVLRTIEKPDWLFWAYLGAVAVTLTAGLALLAGYGLVGALLGLLIASATVSAGSLYFLAARRRSPYARKEGPDA